jgi:hypothetical protein
MSTPRSSVGRYELRERLGAGGMGTVWHAWDPALQRDVAVKEVVLPDGMSPEDHDEARERTLREAQATARIRDNAVVTVHDVLEHEGTPWIVMELLSGMSFDRFIKQRGRLPVEEAVPILRSIGRALDAAHQVWRGGETRATAIQERMRQELQGEPEVTVEYISIVEPDTLAPVTTATPETVVAIAARVGGTRLIDNIDLAKGVG